MAGSTVKMSWQQNAAASKLRWIAVLLAMVMAGFCVLSGSMLLEMRHEAWAQATRASRNLLVAEADDIARTMSIYDLSLRSTAGSLFDADIAQASPRMQQMALFDQAATAPYLGPIRVLTADGVVTHDSATLSPGASTASEREALQRHRIDPGMDLVVSRPTDVEPGRDGDIHLSYRINGPDGKFAGIVIGTIQLAYFSELFRRLQLGPHDVVSLFQNDGTLLAHAPPGLRAGRTIAGTAAMHRFTLQHSGAFSARSTFDGQRRFYTFTHLDGWPLLLDVGLSEKDIFLRWRRRTLLAGLSLLVMGLTGGCLLVVLRREFRLRLEAEREAQANEARYRLLADNSSDVIVRFDSKLIRTYVSPSCCVYGFQPRELLGEGPRSWVHPDDIEQVLAIVRHAQNALEGAEAVYRIRDKVRGYVWVEGRYSYVPSDGGFIVVLRDINRRKEAEQQLELANAELQRLAAVDALTELANRRSFDLRLVEEWRRAYRADGTIAMLVIDVDYFKSYNDHYGHQAGDKVLKDVAAAIQGSVRRPGDCVARYGGEEFVVILPATDLYGAIEIGQSVRRAILALALPHEDNPVGIVTVSIGASSGRPQAPGANVGQLFNLADEALYAAKRGGRNQMQTKALSETAVG